MIFCRICRERAPAACIWRRISASSALALSAISFSSGMARVILSSRKRPHEGRGTWYRAQCPDRFRRRGNPLPGGRTAEALQYPAIPACSAYRRAAPAQRGDTSFAPAKDGLPCRPSSMQAALVSCCKRFTSSTSVCGSSARALALAASDVAWAASFSKTRGSSSVRSDFSNNSSIPFDPSQRI